MRGDEIASDLISSRKMKQLEQRFPVRHVFPELELNQDIDITDLYDKWSDDKMHPLCLGRTSCLISQHPALCDLCRRIFTKESLFTLHKQPLLYQRYRHHKKLDELYCAACSGCWICSSLWMNIHGADEYTPSSHDAQIFEYLTVTIAKHDEEDLYYTLHFIYQGNRREWNRTECKGVQLCVIPRTGKRGSGFSMPFISFAFALTKFEAICEAINEAAVAQDLHPESRLQFAATCLGECEKQHAKCANSPRNTGWQPTRLIDLGPLNRPLEPKLIEVPTTHSESSESYATLSHRWGGKHIFSLTTKTFEHLSRSIDVNDLPKTFQEAFHAVRDLGVRYLWIDALCIIQDSVEDWRKQSALMADVYGNAKFNISSTGGADSTSGLYLQAKFPTDRLCKIELSKSYTWEPGQYYVLNPRFWSTGVSETPLNRRGWVFQERILARRVLHFGRGQLYFECREMDACELFPKGMPDVAAFQSRALGSASNGRFKRQNPNIDGAWLRVAHSMGRLRPNPTLNAYSLWSELVEAYTMMHLTKVGDKLIAISGVAKQMRQILNDQYLAGLWRNHLPFHLLWTKRRDIALNTEPMEYIAPTWSWASINEKVTLYPVTDSDNERILIDIISAETFPVTDDDTGQLVGGCIRLESCLRKCWIARQQLNNSPLDWRRNGRAVARLWLNRQKSCAIYIWPDELDNIFLDNEERERDEVYCMPVHIWWNGEGDCCTEGLILKNASSKPDERWERVYKRFGRFKIPLADTEDTEAFYGLSPPALIQRCKDGSALPLGKLEISLV